VVKIAILYTTFLRNELMHKTVESIFNNWREGFFLKVADQYPMVKENGWEYEVWANKNRFDYCYLPFDCGLSYARNWLVKDVLGEGFKYCIVTADSIQFIPETIRHLDRAVSYMEANHDVGILGFDLLNRFPWECTMEFNAGRFILTAVSQTYQDPGTGMILKDCDICRNFFLARIDTLAAVTWDEQLKLAEHEDFFWRYKQAGYKVRWTPDVVAEYVNSKPSEHVRYRNRIYTEFYRLLAKKYNLTGPVEYRKA
jgi:GT2 family glycosyltransferase